MKPANNPTAKNDRRISALRRLEAKEAYTPEDLKEMETLRFVITDPTTARASRSKIYRGAK